MSPALTSPSRHRRSGPTLIIDVGDVLLTTTPNANYRHLSRLSGLPWGEVSRRLEEARDHVELETGTMDEHEFAVRTAALLGRPSLRSADIRAAWSSVLGHQNVQLLTAAKDFARRGRVLLASNTNPIHWPQCVQILSAPDAELSWVEDVILSFEVGALKPAESFFAEVRRSVELGTSGSVPRTLFVDDKEENVAAARNAGIGAVVHRSNSETIAAIHALR